MNRTLTAALFATVTGAATLTMGGTAGAADPICDTMHAATNVTFTVADGIANLTATAAPGCEGTPFGIAMYATAHLSFDPAETQPLLAYTTQPAQLGPAPVTIPLAVPRSTHPAQCRVQVDAYVGGALPEINPTSRYNEPAVGVDSNGDGQVANRLIAARYVDQQCATVDTAPPTTTVTVTPPAPVELEQPPVVEVVSTPTPAPVELAPPVVALEATPAPIPVTTATLPVTGRNTTGLVTLAGFLGLAGLGSLRLSRKVAR